MTEPINGRTPEEIKKALGLRPHFGCESFEECAYEDEVGCPGNLMMDALALIEHLESERDAALAQVPKWISVEERLPDEDECLAVGGQHEMLIGVLLYRKGDGRYACESDGEYLLDVTHWMPLPEPPKGEEK